MRHLLKRMGIDKIILFLYTSGRQSMRREEHSVTSTPGFDQLKFHRLTSQNAAYAQF